MIRNATENDAPRLALMLARAFDDDPWVNWLVRPDGGRARGYQLIFGETVRHGMLHGQVHTDENGSGAAVWYAPGQWRLGFFEAFGLVPKVVRTIGFGRLTRVLGASSQVTRRHPTAPHWYLFSFGVDPAMQGRGVGGALLRHTLARVDEEGHAAYLETAKETNVALYRRFGFELSGEVPLPDGGPTVYLMWRNARR